MLQLAAMPVCVGPAGETFEVVVTFEVVEVVLMVLLVVLDLEVVDVDFTVLLVLVTAAAEIPTQ